MKKLLLSLLICSTPALAQSSRPFIFDATPSCMWTKTTAVCLLENRLKAPIDCKIHVTGITTTGHRVFKTRTTIIPAGMMDSGTKLAVPSGDLEDVTATAECKAE